MDKEEKQKILEEIGGISEDFYDGLVHDLISQTHERITKLKEALNNSDYDAITESAHFVKGSAGNLRINTIYEIAKSMEEASREKKPMAGIADELKKLECALAELEKEFIPSQL